MKECFVGASCYHPEDYRLVAIAMIDPKAQGIPKERLLVMDDCELVDTSACDLVGYVVTLARN